MLAVGVLGLVYVWDGRVLDCLAKGGWGNSGCTCCSLRLLCGGVSTCSYGCCVAVCVGSGDNRETIHTRSDCCLQPLSLNTHSLWAFCSIISFSVSYILSLPPVAYMPDCYLPHFIFCIPNLSVCVSVSTLSSSSILNCFGLKPSLLAYQPAQKHKHKQLQLGTVIVLLWSSIAFSVKDEVVNNKLHTGLIHFSKSWDGSEWAFNLGHVGCEFAVCLWAI